MTLSEHSQHRKEETVLLKTPHDGGRPLGGPLRRLGTDRRGVTAVEYGVIVALVLVVCVAAIGTLGSNVYSVLFSNIADATAGRAPAR